MIAVISADQTKNNSPSLGVLDSGSFQVSLQNGNRYRGRITKIKTC